jgi:hypothetical protein
MALAASITINTMPATTAIIPPSLIVVCSIYFINTTSQKFLRVFLRRALVEL